jgi:hypothetical protein
VLNENKNFALDNGTDMGAGFYQDMHIQLNPIWGFDQQYLYRHDFDKNDFAFNLGGSLTGRLTSTLGLQLAYQQRHENLVLPGTMKRYQKIMAGLQIKF